MSRHTILKMGACEGSKQMNKAEIIAYAIKKECQRYSLVDWCEEWGFSVDEFNRFLTLGQEAFYQEQSEREGE